MLENSLTSGDIATFKLTSGEELVAKYVSETASTYEVAKPFVLATNPADGKFMLFPYVITANSVSSLHLRKEALSMKAMKTNEQVTGSYIQMTSGIQKASAIPEVPGLVV